MKIIEEINKSARILAYYMRVWDKRFEYFIDYDELYHEMIAIVLENKDKKELFREAHRAAYRLLIALGYNIRKMKAKSDDKLRELMDAQKELLSELENLYIEKGFSVKEICKIYDIEYSREIQKLFSACFAKKLSHRKKRSKIIIPEIEKNWSNKKLIKKYGISRITAWRLRQRGYFYKYCA